MQDYVRRGEVIDAIWKLPIVTSPDGTICYKASDVLAAIEKVKYQDVVAKGVCDQYRFERDVAMHQLQEHGIAFGTKTKK